MLMSNGVDKSQLNIKGVGSDNPYIIALKIPYGRDERPCVSTRGIIPLIMNKKSLLLNFVAPLLFSTICKCIIFAM